MATAFFAPTHLAPTSSARAATPSRGFWGRFLDRVIAARFAEVEREMARYRHLGFNPDSPVLKDVFGDQNRAG
ncbi:hypothetical protein MKI84_17265 [Ancylobacter sp. A5.8]|uniref:hypothetical protein n=1 Tax=Ancylobacter gelatini TaxID=2919920 RepID=UPI001F4D966E|nr:hypothetical protein [Ancylobacter gelatini]MCJ8144675.1 hypothetical protein [Ancylobacter gelatini]